MRSTRLVVVLVALVGLSVWLLPAAAGAQQFPARPPSDNGVVFVQNDNTSGNKVFAYDIGESGALTFAHSYDTGGRGGVLNGSVVDHLASQGSLAYDAQGHLLYAVNAGSNTVSVFSVYGDTLALRQVVSSGGIFPVSVAVSGALVYVLNAENGASVQGFSIFGGRLFPLPWAHRSLGLVIPTGPTQYTSTPGQVAFSPDGQEILVTTKGSSNDVDVFHVGLLGSLSRQPVVNAIPGAVPFAVTFDPEGHLVVTEAGPDAVASFTLTPSGTIAPIDTVDTGQTATCWVTDIGPDLYASNAGSADLSNVTTSSGGKLDVVGTDATGAGTVDSAATPDGRFLYVQTGGAGNVDGFSVASDGSLASVGSVTVPGAAGGEGIVAT